MILREALQKNLICSGENLEKKRTVFLFCACVLQYKIYRAAIATLLEFIAKEKINNKRYIIIFSVTRYLTIS
jgi:hypothetical protein